MDPTIKRIQHFIKLKAATTNLMANQTEDYQKKKCADNKLASKTIGISNEIM